MGYIRWAVILLVCTHVWEVYGQVKYDYTWILGYDFGTSNEGMYDNAAEGSIIDFTASPPAVTAHPIPYRMASSCVMSDPETGKLMFYTNGCSVINADHVVMDNGDGLNPGIYYKNFCTIGSRSYVTNNNCTIALPDPANKNKYYLIHVPKNLSEPFLSKILYTTIDMSANGGKGMVIEKNVLLKDGLNIGPGYFTACKQANGRDWWILALDRDKPVVHTLSLTSAGIRYSRAQAIGTVSPYAFGQAVFSPDGSRYVWYDLARGVHVYDFDRETGMLSRHRSLEGINEYYIYGYGGVSISPSGRYAYLSARYELYQLDLWAENLADGLTHIDSIRIVTSYNIPLNFSNSMLAPDCRIYISTGFAYYYYHIIHHPDEKGKACGLQKLGLRLPFPNSNSSIPNMVHYRMDEDAVCDPKISSIFPTSWYVSDQMVIYPNPTSGVLTIQSQGLTGIEVMDIYGKVVLRRTVSQPVEETDITALPSGIYLVRGYESGGTIHISKIIKQ
jgi:hypothetical protein